MNEYSLIISKKAYADLYDIYSHIARDLNEPMTAANYHKAIVDALTTLCSFPMRHKLIDDEPYHTQGVRMLRIKSFTAFYIVDDDKKSVSVIRVIYSRRDWQNIL